MRGHDGPRIPSGNRPFLKAAQEKQMQPLVIFIQSKEPATRCRQREIIFAKTPNTHPVH